MVLKSELDNKVESLRKEWTERKNLPRLETSLISNLYYKIIQSMKVNDIFCFDHCSQKYIILRVE